MSEMTLNNFEQLVEKYYQQYSKLLNLDYPSFHRRGFTSTAFLNGLAGIVEIRCAPPEYSVDIFITVQKSQKRWTLVDLMRIKEINEWMFQNKSFNLDKTLLEAEINKAFSLLSDGLKRAVDFEWLYSSDKN